MCENKVSENACACCHYKNAPRDAKERKQLQNRINRIAGQLKGIGNMIEDNRYCGDILIQIAAVESALQNLGYVVLKDHLETCVVEEVRKGNLEIMKSEKFVITAMVMVINQKFFVNGFVGLMHKAPNMDTLVTLGSGAAFVYSTAVMFRMGSYLGEGSRQMAFHCLHDMYYESAAMILTLITVGKMPEAYSKGKTTNAIKSLMDLAPKQRMYCAMGKK